MEGLVTLRLVIIAGIIIIGASVGGASIAQAEGINTDSGMPDSNGTFLSGDGFTVNLDQQVSEQGKISFVESLSRDSKVGEWHTERSDYALGNQISEVSGLTKNVFLGIGIQDSEVVGNKSYVAPVSSDSATTRNMVGSGSLQIRNVVASTNVGADDLYFEDLSDEISNADYYPEKFPGLIIHTEDPKTTLTIFESGKIVLTGAESPEDVDKGLKIVFGQLREKGVEIDESPDIKVQNVAGSGTLGQDLKSVAPNIKPENADYSLDVPLIVYYLDDVKTVSDDANMVSFLFEDGTVAVTGARHPNDLDYAVDKLDDIINTQLGDLKVDSEISAPNTTGTEDTITIEVEITNNGDQDRFIPVEVEITTFFDNESETTETIDAGELGIISVDAGETETLPMEIDVVDGSTEISLRLLVDGSAVEAETISVESVAEGATVYVGSSNEGNRVYAQDADTGEGIWDFETDDEVRASPTVVDGTVYIGSFDNNVYALDAETGDEVWRFETGDEVWSSPTVMDGYVYIGSFDNNMYALDAETGDEAWRFDAGDDVRSSPNVVDGHVYFGAKGKYNHNVYSLDASDGDLNWEFNVGGDNDVLSSPTVKGGTVYVGAEDNKVYALDADDGEEEWSYETDGRVWTSPTVKDGIVYVASNNGNVYALDTEAGDEVWHFEMGGSWMTSSPTVNDGTVYIGSTDNNVYAIDASDGTQEWLFETGNGVASDPTFNDGTVYIGSVDGNVYALNAEDGEKEWIFETDGAVRSSPTIVDPSLEESVGTRVELGTLGHHHSWSGETKSEDDHRIIDDFNNGNINEYFGQKNQYNVIEDNSGVFPGDYHLSGFSPGKSTHIISQSGLGGYPSTGDQFEAIVKPESSGGAAGFWFGVQSSSYDWDDERPERGYQIRVNAGLDQFEAVKTDADGSFSFLWEEDFSVEPGNYYRLSVIEWLDNGKITAEVEELDTGDTQTGSATDDSYSSGGFGWLVTGLGDNNGPSMEASFNLAKKIGESPPEEPEPPELSGTVVEKEVNGNGRSGVAGALIEVQSEDGETVAEAYTDGTGRWSVNVEEGEYTVTASYSGETEKETVHHDGETPVVTQLDVSLCEDEEFIVLPSEPVAYEDVRLQACDATTENMEWRIDGESVASGSMAVHSFSSPGAHEITANIDGRPSTQTVEVDEAEFSIAEVHPSIKGPHIPNAVPKNVYQIGVISTPGIEAEKVELETDASCCDENIIQAYPMEDEDRWGYGSAEDFDTWEAVMDLSQIEEDSTVQVTAYSNHNQMSSQSIRREVANTPNWLEWLTENTETDPSRLVEEGMAVSPDMVEADLIQLTLYDHDRSWNPTDLIDFFEDPPLKNVQKVNGTFGIEVPSARPYLEGSGEGEVTVADRGFKGDLDADITFKNDALSVHEGRIEGGGEVDARILPLRQIEIKDVTLIEGDIGATGSLGTGVEFDEFSFDSLVGTFEGGLDLFLELGAGDEGVEGEVELLKNRIEGDGTYDTTPRLRTAGFDYELEFGGDVHILGFEKGVTVTVMEYGIDWTNEDIEGQTEAMGVGETQATLSNVEPTEIVESDGTIVVDIDLSEMELASKYGENPAETSLAEGKNRDRITDRPHRDTQPSVTYVDDKPLAVWSSRSEDRGVDEGRDLMYSTKETQADNWDDGGFLTDDTLHDERPSVAVGGEKDSKALTAWIRLTKDITENDVSPDETFDETEIAFSVYDSETKTWSEKEVMNDSGGFITSSTVDGDKDGWLVAWGSNEDGVGGYDERSVGFGYVSTDDLSMEVYGNLNDATKPDVNVRQDGTLEMVYYEPHDSIREGDLVVGEVDEAGFSETSRYSVEGFSDLSLSEDYLVWIEKEDGVEENVYYTDGTGIERDTLSANISNVDEVNFEYRSGIGVLTYRGRPEIQEKKDIAYRVMKDGEWITDRRVVGGADIGLTLWHSDKAVTEDGFSLIYSAKEFGSDNVDDVFVAEHEYAPEYTVEANASDGLEIGDTATVDYTVRNVGDVDADEPVPVVVESDGQVLSTEDVGPLSVNEAVTDSFDVPVTSSGRYNVSVDPEDETATIFEFGEEDDWTQRSETVIAAEPELYVGSIDAERIGEQTAKVGVSVVNDGGIPVSDMEVSVNDGEESLASTTVSELEQRSSEEIQLTINTDNLNTTLMDSVVLDPERKHSDLKFRFRERSTVLLYPDVAVHEPVRYERYEGDGGENATVASVLVENRGTATANTEVVLEMMETGERVAETSVEIPPAVDGVSVFESVSITLDEKDVESGDELRVSASTERHDPDVTDAGFTHTAHLIPTSTPLVTEPDEPEEVTDLDCPDRRDISRGQQHEECPDDREFRRGQSRDSSGGEDREFRRDRSRDSSERGERQGRDGGS